MKDKKQIQKKIETFKYLIYSETKFDSIEVTITIPDLSLDSEGKLQTYTVFMIVNTDTDGFELESITHKMKYHIEKLFDCLKKYGLDKNLKIVSLGSKSNFGVWGYMISSISFEDEQLSFRVEFACETSDNTSMNYD